MEVLNKQAKFNYEILEKFEAGIVLTGIDVKGVKSGSVNLTNSYGKVINGEAFLVNAAIGGNSPSRRLLLHRREIEQIEAKIKAKKLTLVPLKLYTRGRLIKVELALAKSKKLFEKRETLKKRAIQRDLDRELK